MSILARFLREAEVPAASITPDHAYDFLFERGNVPGLSASWFNVTFQALVAWLEMQQLPTGLRGLRPKRVAIQVDCDSAAGYQPPYVQMPAPGCRDPSVTTLDQLFLGTPISALKSLPR